MNKFPSSSQSSLSDPVLALRRARAAIYVDGLWEIAYGVIWLLMAAFLFGGLRYPKSTSLAVFLTVLAAGSGFASRWIVNRIKERWVYPRTGYVALRPEPLSWRLLASAVVMTLVVIAGLVALVTIFEGGFLPVGLFPLALMLVQLWAVLLPIAAYHQDWRFYALAFLSSSFGVLLYILILPVWGIPWAFFAGLSGGLIFSGVVKLLFYLWCSRQSGEATHGA